MIDLRAICYCSIGKLIQGQIADDYMQDAGLVRTRGSVQLDGIFSPVVGSSVGLAYYRNGKVSRIPRSLVVISSFANPFTNRTDVQIGCMLAYKGSVISPGSDLEARIKAANDPAGGAAIPEGSRKLIGEFITAEYVMGQLLTPLGITASGAALTNKYFVSEFEINRPNLDIVSDLLKSEAILGYIDDSGTLVKINLNDPVQQGVVINQDRLLEIGPLGVGELPSKEIQVRYNTRQLNPPTDANAVARANGLVPPGEEDPFANISDPNAPIFASAFGDEDAQEARNRIGQVNWDRSRSTGSPVSVYFENKAKTGLIVFSGTESTEEITSYQTIRGKDVPVIRKQVANTFSAKAAKNVADQYIAAGIQFNNLEISTVTLTTYRYTSNGDLFFTRVETYEPYVVVAGRLNLRYVWGTQAISFSDTLILTRAVNTATDTFAGWQRNSVSTFELEPFTIEGQIGVSLAKSRLKDIDRTTRYVDAVITSGLVLDDFRVTSSFSGRTTSESRPALAERIAEGNKRQGMISTVPATDLQDAGTKASPAVGVGGGQNQVVGTTFEYGSAEATRVSAITMPFAPDDIYIGEFGNFSLSKADAQARAYNYGKLQNRMRLGSRQGLAIQIPVGVMPVRPFDPMYVQAAGLTGQYRANGMVWAFDGNGIIGSVDAMFWGGVGQT
jgi:hypothetical protein